jgi:hypothetical protein
MNAIRLQTQVDLCETALECAAQELGGVNLSNVTLYCCVCDRVTARQLQGKHGFALVLVPVTMLKQKGFWLIDHPRGQVYSEGVY